MILSDIGEKRGDLPRQLRDIRRNHTESRNARRSENTSIGEGGLRLYDTGGLTVDDGGEIHMRGGGLFRGDDGGKIQLYHPGNEFPCVSAGTFPTAEGTQYGITVATKLRNRLFSAIQFNENLKYAAFGDWQEPLNDFYVESTNTTVNAYGGGFINLNPDTGGIFAKINTTAVGTAIGVDASNKIVKLSSSARFKQDITDSTLDVDAVLRLRTRQWRYKDAVSEHGDAAPVAHGLVAEEVEGAGLGEAVVRDAQGRPDALSSPVIEAALVALVQRQQEQLVVQQQQIDDLSRRLAALENNSQKGTIA